MHEVEVKLSAMHLGGRKKGLYLGILTLAAADDKCRGNFQIVFAGDFKG